MNWANPLFHSPDRIVFRVLGSYTWNGAGRGTNLPGAAGSGSRGLVRPANTRRWSAET